jgi:curli biogenesis system outer membrane secretion channel CsgG
VIALVMLVGCAASKPTQPVPRAAVAMASAPTCADPIAGTIGVMPFKDKTDKTLDVAGLSDLLTLELTNSGCFQVVERAKLDLVIEELVLCDDSNPDKELFDCGSFAEKGKLLGLQYIVFGDVLLYEPAVSGVQLAAKDDSLHVDRDAIYSALLVSVRAVQVETGKVVAAHVLSALAPSTSAPDKTPGEAAASETPFGAQLRTMFATGSSRLHVSLGAR